MFKRILCTMLLLCLTAGPALALTKAEEAQNKSGAQAIWSLLTPQYGLRYIPRDEAIIKVTTDAFLPAREDDTVMAQCAYTVTLQEVNGVGFTIEQILPMTYVSWADEFQAEEPFLPSETYIEPFGQVTFDAGSPRQGNLRYVVYVVSGRDDFGNELEFYGLAERTNIIPETASAVRSLEFDTPNLRLNADFEVAVAQDVWWVPASSLGGTRYTNADIAARVTESPEAKQQTYATLYEALQLYQVSGFASGDDNQRIREGEINWEHHKPGYHAVRTNNGCCATDSNWLNYILGGDYEEVGFLAYSQSDGGGHILNYIKHEGYYYFIDLTHYRMDFLDSSAVESGSMGDYAASDFVAGNIHKAASPEAYAAYCRATFNDPPEIFFLYQAEDCLPVDGVHSAEGITITYAAGTDIQVVFDNPGDRLYFAQVSGPVQRYDWSREADAVFQVDAMFQASAEAAEVSVFGLSCQVGDVFPFEDHGEQAGVIEVDGATWPVSRLQGCEASMEPAVRLYGGNTYAYVEHIFPLSLHGQAIRDMKTVWAGDFMVDIPGRATKAQIVRCAEEKGTLVVTDVYQDCRSVTDRVFLERDASGNWQSPPVTWYLITYELDGVTYQEFARNGLWVQ